MINYWWYKNKQNRVNVDEQILLCDELNEIENYTYSYYSNTNFLNLNNQKEINGRVYDIRLDTDCDFKHFSSVIGASPLFDNALEASKIMTTTDLKHLINGSANLYPENVARYYSNQGNYQYVLLDYTDIGNACLKIVPDRFIPSSYTAFRPIFHRAHVKHEINDREEYADEYKFISEDGCYLLDQSKINTMDDVLYLLSINPCYIDQINPHFFTMDNISANNQNVDIIKTYIDKLFSNSEMIAKLVDLNRPLYSQRMIDDNILHLVNSKKGGSKFTPNVDESLTDQEIISLIYKRVNRIIKEKIEELKFLRQYENYALEEYEKAFLDLGLIPSVNGLKEKFLPPLRKKEYLSKDTNFITRRFIRLGYLKDANEKLELYRDEVLSKIKDLPEDNDYLSYGEIKAQIIKDNDTIARYEEEILSSGYKYKNQNTGIISALNKEYNELNIKISKYFTLPTLDTAYMMTQHLEELTNTDWGIENIYIPHDDHTSTRYNSKPMICLVNKKYEKEYRKYLQVYEINGATFENNYLKDIDWLIDQGIIVPICMTNSNFGTVPSVNNFRTQKTIFAKKIFVNGKFKDISINTYSIKRVNRANQLYKGLKNIIMDLADKNVKMVDKPNKNK